jgi:hypothetical protein
VGITGPTGATGTTGATGATGATATALALSALSTYGNFGSVEALTSGNAVPFSATNQSVTGSAVDSPTDTTFTFSQTGVYLISVSLTTITASNLGSIALSVNSTLESQSATLALAGSNLILQQMLTIPTGATLEVIVGGAGLTLASGNSSQITITQITSN